MAGLGQIQGQVQTDIGLDTLSVGSMIILQRDVKLNEKRER